MIEKKSFMTEAEQDQRRAEMQKHLAQAQDRSSGYWCERDTDGIPFMHCPDGSRRYWPPDKDPTKLSADRAHGDSLEYAVCPKTGQVHNAADTEWWTAHYGRLADEAEKAKAMQERMPGGGDPLVETLLKYAAETRHGLAHVRRWNQALTAIGYDTGEPALSIDTVKHYAGKYSRKRWQPVVDRLLRQAAESQPAVVPANDVGDANARFEHANRPGSPEWRRAQFENRITADLPDWTMDAAKDYYRGKGHVSYSGPRVASNGERYWVDFEMCDDGTERQVDKPVARHVDVPAKVAYVYGEDLEAARKDADENYRIVEYIALTAEIDFLMTNKANVPMIVTIDVAKAVEKRYPKIRLDRVRAYLNG